MDTNEFEKINNRVFNKNIGNMQQFIEDCLKPQYELQWLKSIPLDFKLEQSIIFFVAYSDKRLF